MSEEDSLLLKHAGDLTPNEFYPIKTIERVLGRYGPILLVVLAYIDEAQREVPYFKLFLPSRYSFEDEAIGEINNGGYNLVYRGKDPYNRFKFEIEKF